MAAKRNAAPNNEDLLEGDFLDAAVEGGDDFFGDDVEMEEGQLAVDVYQTKDNVVIKAPIAGVRAEDIEISIADDVITLRGERVEEREVDREHYYVQECYWGSFSRSVILPTSTQADKALANLKDGVLTISIPKVVSDKVKKIKVTPVK